MLKLIEGLPKNVIGVYAAGEVTGTDYENVLIPEIEEKLKTNIKINVLYHISTEFTGFNFSAMLDDAKTGLQHLTHWGKVAFVSDHEIINSFAKFFGYLIPCEFRVFKNGELEDAKKWISV